MSQVRFDPRGLAPALSAACAECAPRPHHGALTTALDAIAPALRFKLVREKHGWFRPGGVVDARGGRVADDLETWADAEWEACGGDGSEFADRHAGLWTTRLDGKTLWLTASYGSGPSEFIQVEIEELREVRDRPLVDPEEPPTELAAVIEPLEMRVHEPLALGPAHYALRNVVDGVAFFAALRVGDNPLRPVERFVADWEASSARTHVLSEHWVFDFHERKGAFGACQLDARPLPAGRKLVEPFTGAGLSGSGLATALQRYDRSRGYPFAWFFALVTHTEVPLSIAETIVQDHDGEYSYLPEADLAIVRQWVAAPYSC